MKTILTCILVLAFAAPAILAADPAVDGLLSLTPVEESSYIALAVNLPDSIPIAGIRWFNNDEISVFPELLIAGADASGRPDLMVSVVADSFVVGEEQAWSECLFTLPVISEVGDVFAVLRLPAYQAISEAGVGPGLGYDLAEGGPTVFLSGDGESWTRVGRSVSVLFEVVQGTNKSGAGQVLSAPVPEVYVTALSAPVPNPFNPSTKLNFTLRKAGRVELTIHDLRGRKVRTLVSGELDTGTHKAIWSGRDEGERSLSSGVYLARLKSVDGVKTQRLMLLK